MEGNIISTLSEIRINLSEAIRAASAVNRKLSGPRPEPPNDAQNKLAAESLTSLMQDVRVKSQILVKLMEEHHNIIGNFGEPAQERGLVGAAAPGY